MCRYDTRAAMRATVVRPPYRAIPHHAPSGQETREMTSKAISSATGQNAENATAPACGLGDAKVCPTLAAIDVTTPRAKPALAQLRPAVLTTRSLSRVASEGRR